MPKLGIVISNYNGWQDTLACLESLGSQTFRDFEVVLLDDGSPNDSVRQLELHLPRGWCFCPRKRIWVLRPQTTWE